MKTKMHPPAADEMPPSTDVAEDAVAPDGTGLEVHRNYGKPSTAAEIAKALREQRKAKGRKATNASSPQPADAEPPESQAPPSRPAPPEPAVIARTVEAKPKRLTPAQLRSQREARARFAGMKPMHVVEAALFSAGKPLLVEEIAETTGLRAEAVKDGVKELAAAYEERDSVLEVGKAGAKWAMQVRSRAAEPAAKFAPMEIPIKVLKTLALIAYHQPMKQSELVDMIGTKVYDHVPELTSRGLVRAREEGVTKILVTTPAFPEYFGLDAEDAEGVRAALAKLVGLPPPPPKAKQELVYEETQPETPAKPAAPDTDQSPPASD
ncbi:MAG: SMC-Scp complex subunit ScpB [Thermoplasmatota archaeon]